MEKLFLKVIIILIILSNLNIVYAEDESDTIYKNLEIADRVNEIVDGVIGEDVKGHEKINYIETAICLNKVIGLSDNMIEHIPVSDDENMLAIEWSSKFFPRRFFIGDCLNAIGFATVFPPKDTVEIEDQPAAVLFYNKWYYDMRVNCTIKNALELAVNCICINCEDYIEKAHELDLFDTVEDYDKLITVDDLKALMRKMYMIKGDLYYSSDLDSGIFESAAVSSEEMSYYERYCRRFIFNEDNIRINNKDVSIMKNKFGASLIGMRDLCEAHGADVEWNNGIVKITYNGAYYELKLDDFPKSIKMLTDNSIYMYHPVVDDFDGLILAESIEYFGQYEMINNRIYLYPITFEKLIDGIGIKSGMSSKDLLYDKDTIILDKDFSKTSDREAIGVIH